ncbi:MAG: HupE/UreJ family protein [Synechococcaceae cyanobacterium RL_1_2]|nr:HupE/UreJ family protein [Synechococcaceae cyanobacterium RL_1_2]
MLSLLNKNSNKYPNKYNKYLDIYLNKYRSIATIITVAIAAIGLWLAMSTSALAHHPLGGKTPSNFYEGLMSGFGHPILGLDHLVFIVGCGLLGAGMVRGLWLAPSFVMGTLLGVGVHLAALNLPATEIVIASSVVLFGAAMAWGGWQRRDNPLISDIVIICLGGVAGIFHGYAYGESIIGAEMGPLFAYLGGLTLIQLAIATGLWWSFRQLKQKFQSQYWFVLRFMGAAMGAIGMVFLIA